MMTMMNFCGMIDRRKAFSLISSRDHFQRSSPSRISDTRRARFEPAQNLSSGEFYTMVQDLLILDSEYFFKQFRMIPRKFEELLDWVATRILKSNVKREVINPEERVCVTLQYVVTGDAHVTIAANYRISPTSISRIIKETTKVIWNVFLDKGFLKTPNSAKEWEKIVQSFENKWNFRHCLGAIDGKHIIMQAPAKSGSLSYNYKKSFSIVC